MKFRVYRLRTAGRRLPRRAVMNGPSFIGQLITHSIEIDGERFHVATLRGVDPIAAPLIPELYEPTILGFSVLAFRLRGFERVERAGVAMGVVQEWHCEQP